MHFRLDSKRDGESRQSERQQALQKPKRAAVVSGKGFPSAESLYLDSPRDVALDGLQMGGRGAGKCHGNSVRQVPSHCPAA